MATKIGEFESTLGSHRKEEDSKSKSRPRGSPDKRRKFDIDSLIRMEHNRSPIQKCCNQNLKSLSSVQDHQKLGSQYGFKPTSSTKRHHEDELYNPESRTSSSSDQNYFTTTANTSKYNVLQVVQPTSSGIGCFGCSMTQQLEQKQERTSTIIGTQPRDCLLDPIGGINSNYETRAQFITDPEIEAPTQLQLNPNLGATADLTAFMPSLTALATYSMFNWCAKCNASFRMTSDLVHHMRTHHKKKKM